MFYKKYVDISNVKSMWNFLHDHYQYFTMNSWNRQKSVAHNVKLYNLKLEGDWTVALRFLHDEGDSGALQMMIEDSIREWEIRNPGYKVFFNGRSGGYLVLGQADSCKSVLPEFVTDYDTYEDFKQDIKDYYGSKVTDFYRELRELTIVVRDFDKLCDELRDVVNWYSKMSFDIIKMTDAIDRFNLTYGDDLDSLGFEGPTITAGSDFVELNACAKYLMFLECFLSCFGEDRRRTYLKDGRLYMKEDY